MTKSREQLLEDAMQAIERDPRHWAQWTWGILIPENVDWKKVSWNNYEHPLDCGSACCIAGQVCIQAGGQLTSSAKWEKELLAKGEAVNVDAVLWPQGGKEGISNAAERLLNLDSEQAKELFHALNTMEQLRVLVDALKENQFISGRDMWELIADMPSDRDEIDEEDEY